MVIGKSKQKELQRRLNMLGNVLTKMKHMAYGMDAFGIEPELMS